VVEVLESSSSSFESSVVGGVVDVVIWRWVVLLELPILDGARAIDGWKEGTVMCTDLAKFDAAGVENALLVGTHGADTNKAVITETERTVCILFTLILFLDSLL